MKQDERVRLLEADVNRLKTDVAELKQKQKVAPEHRYELRNDGSRTWRFDPATGDTCLKLTSAADWKRKETKFQSCEYSDASQRWTEMPSETDQQQKSEESYFNMFKLSVGRPNSAGFALDNSGPCSVK
jgi:hypothetical protein